jgi:hypothetical protein
MSKMLISYINTWAAGTVTASSEHPSFPATNTQHRWYKKPWRSKYGAGSAWGLFRFNATNNRIYFNEGGGQLITTIIAGDYDTETLCANMKARLDAIGALTYTVTYSDDENKFTISASGNFELELSETTIAAWDKLGYTAGVDTGLDTSHEADAIRIHTEEFLYCDAGATSTLRLLAIKNHNLQSTAEVSIRYYSDAFLTEVDHEDLTWHAGQIAARISESYRYFSVRISDPDNPDGFAEVGLVWGADAAQLHYGYTPDRGRVPEDPSAISASEDGQESSIQLSRYADRTYAFDAIEPNTDYDYLEAVFQEIGKSRPCFIVEAPPTLGDVGETAQYVKVVEWEWAHLAGGYWSLEIATRSER